MHRSVAVILTCLTCTGCSFMFVDRPPQVASPGQCSTSQAIPMLDALTAAGGIVGTVLVLDDEGSDDKTFPLVVGIGTSFGFATGAVEGFRRTVGCQKALQEWVREQATSDIKGEPKTRIGGSP